MSYRPGVVREVLIPKANGKMRPLGITNLEDKIVQALFAKILMAIKLVWEETSRPGNKVVIDVDLQNYFGEINHRKLHMVLEMKIKDKKFL